MNRKDRRRLRDARRKREQARRESADVYGPLTEAARFLQAGLAGDAERLCQRVLAHALGGGGGR